MFEMSFEIEHIDFDRFRTTNQVILNNNSKQDSELAYERLRRVDGRSSRRNDKAVAVLGDETLRMIARELVTR